MAKYAGSGARAEAEGGGDFVGGRLIGAGTRVSGRVGGEGAAFVRDG